jgi:hypothetical protein
MIKSISQTTLNDFNNPLLHEYERFSAWETEWQRKGDTFNIKTGRYEAKKGWVSGQAYGVNGYLEIRKFNSDKGYSILEEKP